MLFRSLLTRPVEKTGLANPKRSSGPYETVAWVLLILFLSANASWSAEDEVSGEDEVSVSGEPAAPTFHHDRGDLSAEDRDHPMDWQPAPGKARNLRLPGEGIRRHLGRYPSKIDEKALLRKPLRKTLDSLDPFLRDATLSATIRTAYFRINNEGRPLSQSYALGGNLFLKTGWWRHTVQLGLQPYFSEPIFAPAGEGGTKLLKPNQGAINVVGQAYLEARYGAHHLRVYRQAIDTPFVNEHYDRMIPNLFEAYLLRAKDWHRLDYIAGFITREKTRDSSSFRRMSTVAGAPNTSEGVAILGGRFTFAPNLALSVYNYVGVNTFNTVYAEFDWNYDLHRLFHSVRHLDAKLSLQYSNQVGIGTELVGPVESNAGGIQASLGWEGLVLSFVFTQNSNTGNVLHPWGRYPGFNKSIVRDFDRSGETGLGIWLSHDFGHPAPTLRIPRIPGLGVATNLVFGETPNSGQFASADAREYNLTVDYRFSTFESRWLKGLWLRIRFAFVSFDELPGRSAPAINDYRFIVNYDLPAVL